MSREPLEQILSHLQSAKHILLTTVANPTGDSLGSVLAFYWLLKKQGKKTRVVIDNAALALATPYDFLPGYQAIAADLESSGQIAVEFDLAGRAVRGLTYQTKDDKLIVNILSDDEKFRLAPPVIRQPAYPYDLVVVLDAPDLESLGKIYDEHTEFFYAVPIINIDHQADNEHFGEINLVDLTAVATTEIIFNLIESGQKNLLDHDLATCLLTGIISESKSFQTANITPRTLGVASELVARGGQRELIVARLYGNKTMPTLQLWGRVLSALQTDPEAGLVWSAINGRDFAETSTSEQELHGLVEDLLTHVPGARTLVLIYPAAEGSKAIVHTHRPALDLRKILSPLHPAGARNLVVCNLETTAAETAINTIKQTLSERLPPVESLPKF